MVAKIVLEISCYILTALTLSLYTYRIGWRFSLGTYELSLVWRRVDAGVVGIKIPGDISPPCVALCGEV